MNTSLYRNIEDNFCVKVVANHYSEVNDFLAIIPAKNIIEIQSFGTGGNSLVIVIYKEEKNENNK